ncbi:unnamed protein product [Closterium sp. NIES-54]
MRELHEVMTKILPWRLGGNDFVAVLGQDVDGMIVFRDATQLPGRGAAISYQVLNAVRNLFGSRLLITGQQSLVNRLRAAAMPPVSYLFACEWCLEHFTQRTALVAHKLHSHECRRQRRRYLRFLRANPFADINDYFAEASLTAEDEPTSDAEDEGDMEEGSEGQPPGGAGTNEEVQSEDGSDCESDFDDGDSTESDDDDSAVDENEFNTALEFFRFVIGCNGGQGLSDEATAWLFKLLRDPRLDLEAIRRWRTKHAVLQYGLRLMMARRHLPLSTLPSVNTCLCQHLPLSALATVRPCHCPPLPLSALATVRPCHCPPLPQSALASVRPCLCPSLPQSALASICPCLNPPLPHFALASLRPCLIPPLPHSALASFRPCLTPPLPHSALASFRPCLILPLPHSALASFRPCLCPPLTLSALAPAQGVVEIFGHRDNADGFQLFARPVHSVAGRVYTRPETGLLWEATQNALDEIYGPGQVVAPIILSSDATILSGNERVKVWAVYLSLANIHLRLRWGDSGKILLALLPMPVHGMTAEQKVQLFQAAMQVVLADLIAASHTGIAARDPWGVDRVIWPLLFSYVADFPETCKVSCTQQHGSQMPGSLCYVDRGQLRNMTAAASESRSVDQQSSLIANP